MDRSQILQFHFSPARHGPNAVTVCCQRGRKGRLTWDLTSEDCTVLRPIDARKEVRQHLYSMLCCIPTIMLHLTSDSPSMSHAPESYDTALSTTHRVGWQRVQRARGRPRRQPSTNTSDAEWDQILSRASTASRDADTFTEDSQLYMTQTNRVLPLT
jgi:hypothetical protein